MSPTPSGSSQPRKTVEPRVAPAKEFNPLIVVVPFVVMVLLGLGIGLWAISAKRPAASADAEPETPDPPIEQPVSPPAEVVEDFPSNEATDETAPVPEDREMTVAEWNKLGEDQKLELCAVFIDRMETELAATELFFGTRIIGPEIPQTQPIVEFLALYVALSAALPHHVVEAANSTDTTSFFVGKRRRIFLEWQSSGNLVASVYNTSSGKIVRANVISLVPTGECEVWLDPGLYHFELTTDSPATIRVWLSKSARDRVAEAGGDGR